MDAPFQSVLVTLARRGVRFIVVGGVAVLMHGYLRLTGDLDLVIDLSEENVETALNVLTELGYKPRAPVPIDSFADPSTRQRWIYEKNMEVFSLVAKADGFEVDIFCTAPFDFSSVFDRATRVRIDDTEIRVVPLDVLIEMKRRTGRAKDLHDVEVLERIRKEKGDDGD